MLQHNIIRTEYEFCVLSREHTGRRAARRYRRRSCATTLRSALVVVLGLATTSTGYYVEGDTAHVPLPYVPLQPRSLQSERKFRVRAKLVEVTVPVASSSVSWFLVSFSSR